MSADATGGPVALLDIARSTVTLETADGVKLAADITVPADARTAVALVHGFTAHRRHPSVLGTAEALTAERYAVVAADSRGHGESTGLCTLGDAERLDVSAAVEAAGAIADRVVVVGASMGAIAALRFAADADQLDGVVTVSCPARWRVGSVRSALAAVLSQTPPGRWFLGRTAGVRLAPGWTRAAPPESLAARLTCPLAVVHGLGDKFIPPVEASRLHGCATGRRRLDLVPAMGHAFEAVGNPTIVRAVAWCLEPARPDS